MEKENKILSIQIRDPDLQYDSYYLIIKSETELLCKTTDSKPSIIPMFPIIKSYSSILPFFEFNSITNLTIHLYSVKTQQEVMVFPFNGSNLSFIVNDLSIIKITKYPLIVFEYRRGYYIFRDHLPYTINQEDKNKKEAEKKGFVNVTKKPGTSLGFIDKYLSKTIQRKDLRTKKDMFDKSYDNLQIIKELYETELLKLKSFNEEHKDELANYQSNLMSTHFIQHKRIIKFNKLEASSVLQYALKKMDIVNDVKRLQIKEIEDSIKYYTEENEGNKEKNKLLKIQKAKEEFINKTYLDRTLSEFSQCFFNIDISQSLGKFPPFYREWFKETGMIRQNYYEKNAKTISTLFGIMIQMIIYLSHKFNIPLKTNFCMKGSTSYVSIAPNITYLMYSFAYFNTYEGGFNCIKDAFEDILEYLDYKEVLQHKLNINQREANGIKTKEDDMNGITIVDCNRKETVYAMILKFISFFKQFIIENEDNYQSLTFTSL